MSDSTCIFRGYGTSMQSKSRGLGVGFFAGILQQSWTLTSKHAGSTGCGVLMRLRSGVSADSPAIRHL